MALFAWFIKATNGLDRISRPSHMMEGVAIALGGAVALIAPRNLRLVAGSGRRKTLIWLSGSGCPALLPYGSSTAMTSNWAVAGTGSWTRMRPLFKRRLYASRLACIVETSNVGVFEPSTVRKIASRPQELSKRACTFSALRPIASSTW